MTNLKTITAKFFIAAASVALMSTGAAAQDSTAHHTNSNGYVKTAELHVKASEAPTFKAAVKTTTSKRRIVREALPSSRKSVRTVNIGRIFTTRDHAYDAMTVYKPKTEVETAKMPNLFKPST